MVVDNLLENKLPLCKCTSIKFLETKFQIPKFITNAASSRPAVV